MQILAVFFLSGIMSYVVELIHNKKRFRINEFITIYIFYSILSVAFLAIIGTLAGYGSNNLKDAYNEVLRDTNVFYLIIPIVINVILSILIHKKLGERTFAFLKMSNSLIIGLFLVLYLILGEISNLMTICIVLIGIVHAPFFCFFYKKEIKYCSRNNLKERLKLAVPIISLWIIMMILFLPNELYLSNAEEMEIPYTIFVGTLLVGALVYFVVYILLLVFFLTEVQLKLVCRCIFAITISGYLQGIILNGKMYIMDGNRQKWSLSTSIVNLMIWLIIAGVILFLENIVKKNVDKIYSTICIYLSLILLITWGYLGFSVDTIKAEEDLELTTLGRMELHPDHNVLVFVLDWFDVQIMDMILEEESDFLTPLYDFTWYKNTTSLYSFTAMSVPYLFSGVEWQYDMTESEYREYVVQDKFLLKDIADQNYNADVYTGKYLVSETIADIVTNYCNLKTSGWDRYGILKQMINCSRYKSYPFTMKDAYWYTGNQLASDLRDADIHDCTNDQAFFEELIEEGVYIKRDNRYDGTYKFYHLLGAHPSNGPTDIRAQGKKCMEMIFEYLEQMKRLGVYDEATVIITADHGHNFFTKTYEEQLHNYNLEKPGCPILFVKESNQKNEGGLHTSMAPVSHAQMAATIMKAICDDTMGYGETFEDIEEDRQWNRYLTIRRYDDIPYTKYRIEGYIGNWDNWTIEETDDSIDNLMDVGS